MKKTKKTVENFSKSELQTCKDVNLELIACDSVMKGVIETSMDFVRDGKKDFFSDDNNVVCFALTMLQYFRVRTDKFLAHKISGEIGKTAPEITKKTLLDNSNFIEIVSEITEKIVHAKFGEKAVEEIDGENIYTDIAQDFFNENYDAIETTLNKKLNVWSDV